jgi:hypothetical protein
LVKCCKNKDIAGGNTGIVLEGLRNKFKQLSSPYLLKLEKLYRKYSLRRFHAPDIWMT